MEAVRPGFEWTAAEAASITELLRHVEPAYRSKCERFFAGWDISFAQGWQDWYAFHNVFRSKLTWGKGVYVDIGSK
jgi:hypothetical protein